MNDLLIDDSPLLPPITSEVVAFTDAQTAEMQRVKQWFPYRIVFGVIHRATGGFECHAVNTMHRANKLARAGNLVAVLR